MVRRKSSKGSGRGRSGGGYSGTGRYSPGSSRSTGGSGGGSPSNTQQQPQTQEVTTPPDYRGKTPAQYAQEMEAYRQAKKISPTQREQLYITKEGREVSLKPNSEVITVTNKERTGVYAEGKRLGTTEDKLTPSKTETSKPEVYKKRKRRYNPNTKKWEYTNKYIARSPREAQELKAYEERKRGEVKAEIIKPKPLSQEDKAKIALESVWETAPIYNPFRAITTSISYTQTGSTTPKTEGYTTEQFKEAKTETYKVWGDIPSKYNPQNIISKTIYKATSAVFPSARIFYPRYKTNYEMIEARTKAEREKEAQIETINRAVDIFPTLTEKQRTNYLKQLDRAGITSTQTTYAPEDYNKLQREQLNKIKSDATSFSLSNFFRSRAGTRATITGIAQIESQITPVTEPITVTEFTSPKLESTPKTMYHYLKAEIPKEKRNKFIAKNIALRTAEEVAEGLIFSYTIGGALGRSARYLFPSTTKQVALTGVIGAGFGYNIYNTAKETERINKELGLSGGFKEGLTTASFETAGFLMGATRFKYSPLQFQKNIINQATNQKAYKLTLENPLGKSAYPLVTYSKGKIYTGMPPPEALGLNPKMFNIKPNAISYGYTYSNYKYTPKNINLNSLAPLSKTDTAILRYYLKTGGLKISNVAFDLQYNLATDTTLRGAKLDKISTLDLSKSKMFNYLTKAQQKALTTEFKFQASQQKGWKGLKQAFWNEGLEQIYGSSTISAEGGYKTNVMRPGGKYADIDVNYRDTALDKAQQFYKILNIPGGTPVRQTGSLVEIKTPRGWQHLLDLHGTDTPDLTLQGDIFGIRKGFPKEFRLDDTTIRGQRLPDSLLDKASSVSTLRLNRAGKYIVSPEAERIPKDVVDFVSILERLNMASGSKKTSEIESLKNIYKILYGNTVRFTGDSKLLFSSSIPSTSTTVIPSISLSTPSISTSKSITTSSPSVVRTTTTNIPSIRIKTPSPSPINIDKIIPSPVKIPSYSSKTSSSISLSSKPSRPSSSSPYSSPSIPSPSPSPSPSKPSSSKISTSSISNIYSSKSSKSSYSPSSSISRSFYSYTTPPAIVITPPPDLLGFGGFKFKRRKRPSRSGRAYIQDFTSKALGIKPIKVTSKQMRKLFRKTFTGLEVRVPVVRV